MKQLLMIVPFFPPMAGGGVYRPLSFVKYLGGYGWLPTVIAPRGDAFWIRDERLVYQIPPDCRVVRTETKSAQGLLARLRGGWGKRPGESGTRSAAAEVSGFKRSSRWFSMARKLASTVVIPDTYVGWSRYAKRAAMAEIKNRTFDAIYSTSPPETSHLIAYDIQARTGLPWVADFRDPWMNLYLLKPPTPVHARLHARLEKKVCERAHTIVTTRWHEQLIREKYPGSPGLTRISNGFDAAEAANIETIGRHKTRFRITHAGMLTQNRTSEPFLRGLRRFLINRPDARPDLEILFVGPREDKNEMAVKQLELTDVVKFRDSVPHDEALQLERASHILLLIKHINPDYKGIVPGKLYEYIGVRRPILALVPDGEAAQLITDLRRGIVAPQSDEHTIAEILERLFTSFKEDNLDDPFDLSPLLQFSRKSLAGELAGLLDAVTGKQT
jgi:glycosyltransferase involved in cell wall biosynthesis